MHKQIETTTFVANEDSRLVNVLSRLLKKLGTQTAIQCSDYLRLRDSRYFEQTLDSLSYSECDTILFAYDLFAIEVLSKSKNIFADQEPERKGYLKFIESEIQCKQTNFRLYHDNPERDVEECLFGARRKISDILGTLCQDDISEALYWGPGVTKSVRGRYVNLNKLMEYPFQCPSYLWKYHSNNVSSSYPYLAYLTKMDIDGPCCLLESSYEFDDCARVTVVPKNSKTSRPITVEPTCVASMAASVGKLLRSKLRGVGVDLRDQTVNRDSAYLALTCGLATVDLSSASDTVSLMIVQELLPREWSDFLMSVRCSSYYVDDPDIKYQFEKFAGMGNGITFPLETLIFYALAFSATEQMGLSTAEVTVYGDDIIIDSFVFPLLSKVFKYCGFSINLEKTHVLHCDLYRESCGAQYFNNADVTPVFIRDVNKDLDTCVRNHNRLYRWLVRNWRHDLLPILGTLRPPDALCVLVGDEIPEDDVAFFLHRGVSSLKTYRKPKSAYFRTKSEDFMWYALLSLESTEPLHDILFEDRLLTLAGEQSKLSQLELLSQKEYQASSFAKRNYVYVAMRNM